MIKGNVGDRSGTQYYKTLGNDITNLPKDTPHDQISQRTKDFVSRFELLKHKPDDETSGFSATLFKDIYNKEYIFAIRENQTINHLEVCNGYK